MSHDTDYGVPFDSGIGGSRGTRVASGAAFTAACEARENLLALAEKLLQWPRAEIELAGNLLVHKRSNSRERWDELLKGVGRRSLSAKR